MAEESRKSAKSQISNGCAAILSRSHTNLRFQLLRELLQKWLGVYQQLHNSHQPAKLRDKRRNDDKLPRKQTTVGAHPCPLDVHLSSLAHCVCVRVLRSPGLGVASRASWSRYRRGSSRLNAAAYSPVTQPLHMQNPSELAINARPLLYGISCFSMGISACSIAEAPCVALLAAIKQQEA